MAMAALGPVYVLIFIFWRPSPWFAVTYAGLSAITFVVCAIDKSAARRRGCAHRSAFRRVFWVTVAINPLGAFQQLCRTSGQ
jgi:uncharacterized membrane protein YsdA (DUF1294 family)